jgi:dTMP kinase
MRDRTKELVMFEGKFFTFEGNEGAGKTTQVKMLADRLIADGYKVKLVREPGGTPLGEAVRSVFKDPALGGKMCSEAELFLIQASRAQLCRDVILPYLTAGYAVIADRFTDSTLVYQGFVRGIDTAYITLTSELATMYKKPDQTFFLKLPLEVSMSRMANRGTKDRLEGEEGFVEKVHNAFNRLPKLDPARIVTIDANRDVDTIHNEIYSYIKLKFQQVV